MIVKAHRVYMVEPYMLIKHNNYLFIGRVLTHFKLYLYNFSEFTLYFRATLLLVWNRKHSQTEIISNQYAFIVNRFHLTVDWVNLHSGNVFPDHLTIPIAKWFMAGEPIRQ